MGAACSKSKINAENLSQKDSNSPPPASGRSSVGYVEKLFKVNKDQMEGMGMQDVDFITAQNMKEFHIDGEDDDDEDEEESKSHVAEAKPPPEAPAPAPAPAPVE
ncbi:hypothetical protein TL16_g05607 [Triparma laevis f. inornata]|uniref:Uncharacterized protein n=1 Tax=Triparma laevis f. inornata TaxID=1714386 RepID=A0A9W7E9W9_9STRA|nr:hypothetical protein TL16_g05607 [Triparma laevis f. inornata]